MKEKERTTKVRKGKKGKTVEGTKKKEVKKVKRILVQKRREEKINAEGRKRN